MKKLFDAGEKPKDLRAAAWQAIGQNVAMPAKERFSRLLLLRAEAAVVVHCRLPIFIDVAVIFRRMP